MTADDAGAFLDAIRARADAATEGPWEFGDRYHVAGVGYGFGDDRCCYCGRLGAPTFDGRGWLNGKRARIHVHTGEPGTGWRHGIVAVRDDGPIRVVNDTDEYGYMDDADAEFIAHAREDVPFLVAVVDYLDRLYPLAVRAVITEALTRQTPERGAADTAPAHQRPHAPEGHEPRAVVANHRPASPALDTKDLTRPTTEAQGAPMTSPVSRDRLDVILRYAVWGLDMPLSYEAWEELKAAAAYALDADDRIAALEAERETWQALVNGWERGATEARAERDALRERVAALEADVDRLAREKWDAVTALAQAGAAEAERDALAQRVAAVRARLASDDETHWYAGQPDHRCIDVADVLAILDGEAP